MRRLPLVVATLLVALLPAAATAAPADRASAEAAHRAKVLAYWTPERMRTAIPRDLVFDPVRGVVPAPVPTGKSGGGSGGSGGGGGSVANSAGSSYNAGGAALTGTGRIYFTLGGSNYICSGSVLTDSDAGRSLVLSAGHCSMNAGGSWATNWLFIPQFDTAPTYTCANTVKGCWTATAIYGDNGFKSAADFNAAIPYDWSIAVVGAGGLDGKTQLDTAVGGTFALETGVDLNAQTAGAYGYPAEGKYKGSDLIYCQGSVFQDSMNSNATWGMNCSMTGGASGGPWLKGDGRTYAATAVSLNSYRYNCCGLNNMYGPKFNARTAAVYTAANGLSSASGNVVKTTLP